MRIKFLNSRMLKSGVFLVLLMLSAQCAHAFLNDVKILAEEEIQKLSDSALADAYIDTIVELKAVEAFHKSTSFNPKEYKAYKDLLKQKIYFLGEFRDRKLRLPPTDISESTYSSDDE